MNYIYLGDGVNRNSPVITDLIFEHIDLNYCVVTIIDMLALLIMCLRLKNRFVMHDPLSSF